jgi:hypothetical protein
MKLNSNFIDILRTAYRKKYRYEPKQTLHY